MTILCYKYLGGTIYNFTSIPSGCSLNWAATPGSRVLSRVLYVSFTYYVLYVKDAYALMLEKYLSVCTVRTLIYV